MVISVVDARNHNSRQQEFTTKSTQLTDEVVRNFEDGGGIRAGPMKKPRSIEEWEEAISEHRKGVIIFHRDLFNSKAFLELSNNPIYVSVLLAAHEQIYYEKKSKNSNRPGLKNGGKIYLPQNLLKARRIKSNKTIADAKKKLVELGFLDVVETGSVHHASVFRVSYRWREYPNGGYLPKEKKLPGESLYSDYGLQNPEHPVNKKRHAKKMSVQKSNVNAVQKLNVTEVPSVQDLNVENPQIFQ
jgi:hypothetical protein